jgi:hypothetical protein
MSIATTVLLGVLGAGMSLAVPSSPATAAEGVLSPTVDLSAPGFDGIEPQVGVDASGRAISVWERDGVIQTRWSSDGGVTWSPAVDLSADADMSDSPRITLDASGRAIAAWRAQGAFGYAIQARLSADGGATWSNTVTLAQQSRAMRNPRVSINSSGDAVALWVAKTSRVATAIQTSSTPDFGVTWSTPTNLVSLEDNFPQPQVAIDSAGRAIAVWENVASGYAAVQTKSSLDGGLNWSAAVTLSQPIGTESTDKPRLSIDGSGRAIAVWERNNIIQSSSSPDGGVTWSPAVDLSSNLGISYAAEVSIGETGRAIAIWRFSLAGSPEVGSPEVIIQTSSSLDGGLTWSPAIDVSEPEYPASDPEVSVDGMGRAVAVWESQRWDQATGEQDPTVIQLSMSTDGGLTWSPAVTLSAFTGEAHFAQLNTNSSGRVFVVWQRYDFLEGEWVVQTRSYLFPAALADTGANDSVMGASVMATAGLLAAGALALAMRRRLARS